MQKRRKSNEQPALKAPKGYARLPGSWRPVPEGATFICPPREKNIAVTIVLRRRPDGPPVPGLAYFAKTPSSQRRRMPQKEFADKYGAARADINKVVTFVRDRHLTVGKTHAARRTVVVRGTPAQMRKAFFVELRHYERVTSTKVGPVEVRGPETFRGRVGYIWVPKNLVKPIVGIFGFDNRRASRSQDSLGDPLRTTRLTVKRVTQLYNFPSPGPAIAGQTIGIIAPSDGGGYLQSDLDAYFRSTSTAATVKTISVDKVTNGAVKAATTLDAPAGATTLTFAPRVMVSAETDGACVIAGTLYGFRVMDVTSCATCTTIKVAAVFNATGGATAFPTGVPRGTVVYFNLDGETTQDICIAASAAPGAKLAVYFGHGSEGGWVELLGRAVHPDPGDFPSAKGVKPPSVLSVSWHVAPGDDPSGLAAASALYNSGITVGGVRAIDLALQDAALQGITVCMASGDLGTDTVGDGYAHVQYPASDPWVLSVGGTTIGRYQPGGAKRDACVEWVWKDDQGATGGGVSDCFPLPLYQRTANVPTSINRTTRPRLGKKALPTARFRAVGRGVPDVAANASRNSGYPVFLRGQDDTANGTSAAAPLWAALIAITNSNLGFNVGFVNPMLYAIGPSVFCPINPLWRDPKFPQLKGCPTNNGHMRVPGYKAGARWDACTGWGSPNGTALLAAIKSKVAGNLPAPVTSGVSASRRAGWAPGGLVRLRVRPRPRRATASRVSPRRRRAPR